jgi:hypothetical protein
VAAQVNSARWRRKLIRHGGGASKFSTVVAQVNSAR